MNLLKFRCTLCGRECSGRSEFADKHKPRVIVGVVIEHWDNVRDRWSQHVTHICDICRPKLEEIVFPKDISK